MNPRHVYIATPCAGSVAYLPYLRSVEAAIEDLTHNEVRVSWNYKPGDSLVPRARHRLVHEFLNSDATHLLFWDNDIELLDPTIVLQMLDCKKDVIAGACPFKNLTGDVVANLWPADLDSEGPLPMDEDCVQVQDAGTGFMLISRVVFERLMSEYPELEHWDPAYPDKPMWSFFPVGVQNGHYLSEDYYFCSMWQDVGGVVYVYVKATFRHYGLYGYEGSFLKQYDAILDKP